MHQVSPLACCAIQHTKKFEELVHGAELHRRVVELDIDAGELPDPIVNLPVPVAVIRSEQLSKRNRCSSAAQKRYVPDAPVPEMKMIPS